MFNFFSKTTKKGKNTKAKYKKGSASNKNENRKKPNIKENKVSLSPDQTMQQAAEKLEAVRRRMDNGASENKKNPPIDRQTLIKRAIALQKKQAGLLDKLDVKTRRKLKMLAMERMGLNLHDKDK